MKNQFLYLATTTTLLLLLVSTTANAADYIYDVSGDPVVSGGKYYISPYDYTDLGGGFNWRENRKILAPCPEFDVYQVKDNTDFGQSIAFYPTSSRQNKVTLSTGVNVAFPEVTPPASVPFVCPGSTNVWAVKDGKKVVLGGTKGSRDPKSVFLVNELDTGGYSIDFCSGTCQKVGVDADRNVVLNGTNALAVVFETEQIFLNRIRSYVA